MLICAPTCRPCRHVGRVGAQINTTRELRDRWLSNCDDLYHFRLPRSPMLICAHTRSTCGRRTHVDRYCQEPCHPNTNIVSANEALGSSTRGATQRRQINCSPSYPGVSKETNDKAFGFLRYYNFFRSYLTRKWSLSKKQFMSGIRPTDTRVHHVITRASICGQFGKMLTNRHPTNNNLVR